MEGLVDQHQRRVFDWQPLEVRTEPGCRCSDKRVGRDSRTHVESSFWVLDREIQSRLEHLDSVPTERREIVGAYGRSIFSDGDDGERTAMSARRRSGFKRCVGEGHVVGRVSRGEAAGLEKLQGAGAFAEDDPIAVVEAPASFEGAAIEQGPVFASEIL